MAGRFSFSHRLPIIVAGLAASLFILPAGLATAQDIPDYTLGGEGLTDTHWGQCLPPSPFTAGADLDRPYAWFLKLGKAPDTAHCDPAKGGWWDWILGPFMWVTGGLLPPLIVGLIILLVYMRTKSAIFAGVIGALYLPVAILIFPETLAAYGIIMMFLVVGIALWYGVVRQADRNAA